MRRRKRVPFDGPIPDIKAGDPVECRGSTGRWVPMIAAGPARYDDMMAIGMRVFLTVPVYPPREPHQHYNWPAEDVRRAGGGNPGGGAT